MIKDAVNIPVMFCGGVYSPDIGEKLLEDGVCDCVGIGKPALADPFWAKKVQAGRAEDIRPCIGCGVGCHDRGMLSGNSIHAPLTLRSTNIPASSSRRPMNRRRLPSSVPICKEDLGRLATYYETQSGKSGITYI